MPDQSPKASQEVLRVVAVGFWRRAAAAAVDLGILCLVLLPVTLLGGKLLQIPWPAGGLGLDVVVEALVSGHPMILGVLVAWSLLAFLYFFLFLAARGQTPGKRLVRARVITSSGTAPGPLRALGRTASYAVSGLLLSLGFLWIGFDRHKRGLHDWLAGTYVVRA
jgi:uncharacterized RDD family membrane protein YckC